MSANIYDSTAKRLIPFAGNSATTAASLDGLSDVSLSSPTDGQALVYDGTAAEWKNVSADSAPTSGSSNFVMSGGVHTALQGKANSADLGTAASKDVATSGDASASQVVMGNDSRLTDARNAADVSAWAKAATKPTYTASEVGLGNVGNFKAVSTEASQSLTNTEKANARANIGAGTEIIKRTVTANAGSTSVTFTNIPTTSDYLLTLFSTSKTLEYDEVTSVSNSVTYTFDSLETSVDFTLKIEEV